MAPIVYLDTHLAVWLYYGRTELIPDRIKATIERSELLVSPMVTLEIQYLHQVKRVSDQADVVLAGLFTLPGVKLCDLPFERVVGEAVRQSWTRDPFDRLIVAHAVLRQVPLLTKDRTILESYPLAQWE